MRSISATFQRLETERKTLQTLARRICRRAVTASSKQIGMLKGKGEDASAVMAEVAAMKSELEANEVRLRNSLKEFDAFVAIIPNVPQESVPVGKSEADNVEVHRWGTPRSFDFPVKDHVDLGESLGQLDFATAAKIAGARFSLMKGGSPNCTVRSRNSCLMCIPKSTATPKSTRHIWSTLRA